MTKRIRFFTPNDPHQMRIYPALAEEIGFNESIVLLQLEYLIGISTTEEHDGQLWTYQTLEDLHTNYFPWISTVTISRVMRNLESQKLILIGNYNKFGFDRTQWYAINWDECKKLTSIKIDENVFQNEKDRRVANNIKSPSNILKDASEQNVTTIPENTTENTTNINNNGAKAPASNEAPENKQQGKVEIDLSLEITPGGRILHALLERENMASQPKRRTAKRFPTLACMEKWRDHCENRLNGNLKDAITRALQKGIRDIPGIVDFVAKYDIANGANPNRPVVPRGPIIVQLTDGTVIERNP